TAQDAEPAVAPIFKFGRIADLRPALDGEPQIAITTCFNIAETGGEDTDDRHIDLANPANADLFSDDGRVGAEARSPEAVADDNDHAVAGVFRRENAAERGFDSKRGEEIVRDEIQGLQVARIAFDQRCAASADCDEIGQRRSAS